MCPEKEDNLDHDHWDALLQYLRIFGLDFQETPPSKIECGLNIPTGFFELIFNLKKFRSSAIEIFMGIAIEIFLKTKNDHTLKMDKKFFRVQN